MTQDNNERHWFVAYVMACRERKAAEALAAMGYEHYLPIQREARQWSDRKKIVERMVLPRMIFIRCTNAERVPVLKQIPAIYRFMTSHGPYTPVVVPDIQLETFRSMVERSGRPVSVTAGQFAPGDKVRVKDGPLTGCVCELISVSGKKCLAVRLGAIGTVTVEMELETLEIIKD